MLGSLVVRRCVAAVAVAALLSLCAAQELPLLPDDFSAAIEGVIVNKNYTVDILEHYDFVNNRLRVENHRHNSSIVQLYFYDQGLHYSIDNGVCRTFNITKETGRSFGARAVERDSHHLRRAADIYFETRNMSYTYRGVQRVRGILCDKWTAFRNASFVSPRSGMTIEMAYDIEWYFSIPQWRTRGAGTHRVPVRIVVDGNHTTNGVASPFLHYYDWTDFKVGTPDRHLFDLPDDIFCPAPYDKPLPRFENSFESSIQLTSPTRRRTMDLTEYYDFDNNRVRLDIRSNGVTTQEYFVGDHNKHYKITIDSNDRKTCETTPIEGNARLPRFYDASTHHLRAVTSLLTRDPNAQWKYGGVRVAHGIECDTWATTGYHNWTRGSVNFTHVYYFAVDNWMLPDGTAASRNGESPTIVFHVLKGTWHPHGYNKSAVQFEQHTTYTNFVPGTPSPTKFNVPRDAGCDLPPLPDDDDDDAELTKAQVGAIVLACLFVGTLMGGSIVWQCIKRRQIRFDRLTNEQERGRQQQAQASGTFVAMGTMNDGT